MSFIKCINYEKPIIFIFIQYQHKDINDMQYKDIKILILQIKNNLINCTYDIKFRIVLSGGQIQSRSLFIVIYLL